MQNTLATLSSDERSLWDLIERDDSSGELIKPDELTDKRSLWELLNRFDPAMASRWHFKDARKVLRSIRVLQTTGKRHSDWLREQDERDAAAQAADLSQGDPEARSPWRMLIFWVWRDPARLNASLDARIHKMLERGLLDEIRELRGIANNRYGQGAQIDYTRGIFQAIGYKEFDPYLTHLERRAADGVAKDALEDEQARKLFKQGVERMQISTRQYAKKQVGWIRNKLAPEVRRIKEAEGKSGLPSSIDVYLLDVTDDFDTAEIKAQEILKGERLCIDQKRAGTDKIFVIDRSLAERGRSARSSQAQQGCRAGSPAIHGGQRGERVTQRRRDRSEAERDAALRRLLWRRIEYGGAAGRSCCRRGRAGRGVDPRCGLGEPPEESAASGDPEARRCGGADQEGERRGTGAEGPLDGTARGRRKLVNEDGPQ